MVARIIASSKSTLLPKIEDSDEFLEQKGVTVMDWVARPSLRTPTVLWASSGTILSMADLTQEKLCKLVESMPKRVMEVISAREGSTRY